MLEKSTISEYIDKYVVQWATSMPAGCPPTDILVPFEHAFYRLSRNENSYSNDDFLTYKDLNPQKEWGDMLPLAVGLSLIDDPTKAKSSLKLPYLKKFRGIIYLELNPTDGVVKQTGVHKSHYTWWRTTTFDMSNLSMLKR